MAELLRAPTEGYVEAIVVPSILAEQFKLKYSLINMMTSDQFFGLEKDNPHDHIRWFSKITFTIKYEDVPNSAIKLMLFPFSLAGAARRTTNLCNEISNFQQQFDESFHEAWDRYKDILHACPHHGFTKLHQLDKFYNALNSADQDSLNSVAGGNLLERHTQDVLTIIENKSKQTYSCSQSANKCCDYRHDSYSQTIPINPPLAFVKSIEEICVTCGDAHLYYQCLAADGNTFPQLRDNIQGYVAATAVNYNQAMVLLGRCPEPKVEEEQRDFVELERDKLILVEIGASVISLRIDMVIKDLDLEPKIDAMMRNFLDIKVNAARGSYYCQYKRLLKVNAALRLTTTEENILSEDIKVLKVEIQMKETSIKVLRRKLEIAQKEKDRIQLTVDKLENASKGLNKLIECHIVDNCKKGLGYENYNAVLPPYTRNFMPPTSELFFTCLDEFAIKPVDENTKSCEEETKVVRKNNDAPIIEEWVQMMRKRMLIHKKTTFKNSNVNQRVNTVNVNNFNTAMPKAAVNVVKGNNLNVVKASACWVWKLNTKVINHVSKCNSTSITLKKFDYIDAQGISKVPRKNNMYSVDLKNIVPKGCLTCPFAKVISDESKLWESSIEPLVCQNKELNQSSFTFVTYGLVCPTFVKILMKKMYCLVVTDDFSRFTCVFFLAIKDETSGILKSFITRIENLVDHKVKVVRCDNGTEFKNREMNQFCEIKDHLGKFDGKADEGLCVGYSLNSKAFRVFNSRTRIVKENLHIRFSESTPNVVGTQSNDYTGTKASDNAEKEDNINSTNNVNTISLNVNDAGTNEDNELPFDPNMPSLEDVSIFNFSNDDEDDDIVANMNNMDTTIQVSHIQTTRIHKDHPLDQVIGDLHSATQTRQMLKNLEKHEFVSTIQQRTNHKDLQICLFACFLSQEEPKKMDVKSAFVYKKIKEEVYVCQPPGFKDPNFLDRVYKVEKALYGLHQALEHGVKNASTPMEIKKPLLNDEEEVDVHMYRPMIGSLMYLTSSRPNIMFSVCAYARYQVNLKVSHLHAMKRIFRLSNHERNYVSSSHTKKFFGNMMRIGKGFSRRTTPLFPTMMVQSQLDEGSEAYKEVTVVPQPSEPIEHVVDEAVHKELEDSLVRAATTASSRVGQWVESSDKESLGEDASKKERRINDIDANGDITLDKGKGILVEEPVKPKKKNQIRLDKEAALKLQAEFDEEQRLAREKAKKEL
nr:hypothetical protein [Tanacetum cinerariifolium]